MGCGCKKVKAVKIKITKGLTNTINGLQDIMEKIYGKGNK